VLELKEILATLQVERADLYVGRAVLSWGDDVAVVSPERLIDWVGERQGQARLLPPGRLEIRWPDHLEAARGLDYLGNELQSLATESSGAESITDGN
jgi:transcription-repair coupling factor (superfamily II helicase)